MVAAFSLLVVGTSLIGTLLAFTEFFKEQLKNGTWHSPPTEKVKLNYAPLISMLITTVIGNPISTRNKVNLRYISGCKPCVTLYFFYPITQLTKNHAML